MQVNTQFQYEDNIKEYLDIVKMLYKDMITVAKDKDSGEDYKEIGGEMDWTGGEERRVGARVFSGGGDRPCHGVRKAPLV